jgi:hypothetical protein
LVGRIKDVGRFRQFRWGKMFPKISKTKSLPSSESKRNDHHQKNIKKLKPRIRFSSSSPQPVAIEPQQLRPCPISLSSSPFYNYRIYPGNNTRVLINAFRRRKWWRPYHETNSKQSSSLQINFIWEMYRNPKRYQSRKYKSILLNHIQNNSCLVSKKGLYLSLKSYCQQDSRDSASVSHQQQQQQQQQQPHLTDIIPMTFYLPHPSRIKDDSSSDYEYFLEYNLAKDPESSHIWIMKPSSCSNRGFGIIVVRGYQEVLSTIGYSSTAAGVTVESHPQDDHLAPSIPPEASHHSSSSSSSSRKGWIVQSYLYSPLLISGRKFDIRCYVLLVLIQGNLEAYSYEDGYVRTSSKRYHLNNLTDREIHLTNDAIQKKSKSYGKHENGNKLTYHELNDILNTQQPELRQKYPPSESGTSPGTGPGGDGGDVVNSYLLPQIKQQILHSIKANKDQLRDSQVKRSFELLGYDFMIDSELKTYLIEINSNPCLEFSCPMLEELIGSMIEGVFQIAVDRICPSPAGQISESVIQQPATGRNKWELLDIN